MSELTSAEEVDFTLKIPDDELKTLVIDASPDTITSAVNTTNDFNLNLFANRIMVEKYEAPPTEMTWVGIR
jgi:hypothetical protein